MTDSIEPAGDAPRRLVAVVYNPLKAESRELRVAVEAAVAAVNASTSGSAGAPTAVVEDAGSATAQAGLAGSPIAESLTAESLTTEPLTAEAAPWDSPLWLETTVDDAGHGLARRAVEDGADLVLAAGGDGTIRAVAAGLRGSGVPLGIIPLGTGNLLARNLGLPLTDLPASVRTAFSGVDKQIDVGVAELTRENGASSEHVFLVMAGLGIDAAMIANTSPQLKKRVGWLAYIDGGLRSIGTKKLHIHYTLPGHPPHSAHVSTILAGNCGVLPGNMELMPDASLDDGELDIALLQPRTVFGWLLIWRKVTWENRVLRRSAFGRRIIRYTNSDKATTLTYLRGPSVRVELDHVEQVELDGDGFGEVAAAHFWADAGALVVRVPHPA
ncbi:diacylglycerol/lipid kinase family protein [Humibacter albus]|uniref:diacylglycerol/lipid kinase family protein n=1 Tax=Humibacter albus TaxID=427754 RepID=UPI0003B7516A|nr:diacylglycerol kinase family protein [Humibacter albus]